MAVKKVALLTAGGFAPCLSTAISGLIQRYTEVAPEVEIIAYKHGYEGLLRETSSRSPTPFARMPRSSSVLVDPRLATRGSS